MKIPWKKIVPRAKKIKFIGYAPNSYTFCYKEQKKGKYSKNEWKIKNWLL